MAQIEPITIRDQENKGEYLRVLTFPFNSVVKVRAEIMDKDGNVLFTTMLNATSYEDVAQQLNLTLIKQNNMAQHFESLTVYEKMDLLIDVSNGIRKDIEKRLVDNPDIVEQNENAWLWRIISNLPHQLIVNELKERLSMFDRDTKYEEQ